MFRWRLRNIGEEEVGDIEWEGKKKNDEEMGEIEEWIEENKVGEECGDEIIVKKKIG